MTTQEYLKKLTERYQLGNATEHTFRADLQNLLETLVPYITATNEPKRIACGAPDYVLTTRKNEIPVGYIEAKDIGVKLNGKAVQEQFDRYKEALDNLAFTDYLDFHFYRKGVFTYSIRIGEVKNGKIVPLPENFAEFEMAIKGFAATLTQSIITATMLAEMMAQKAKFIAFQIENALVGDKKQNQDSELMTKYEAFQKMLVPDLSYKAFADMYAQTIAYGMFAARYHDPTLETFSREEAAKLIPMSNPFLRKLFQDIAGFDLDERINYLVDDLVQIFLASNVREIMEGFGTDTQQEDPVIHFYETFLAKYDPALRKARGVWYTPQPVVNFIVRAVDDILKNEFGLKQGLADSSKIKKKVIEKGEEVEKEFHKVQILDPAVGTGTFLAEIVEHIHKKFKNQQGIWKQYVEKELIPRLNGFELLMTSYAMAHLKLDILLTEKGFTNDNKQRFRVFLTNSLTEATDSEFNQFSQWLSVEANEANKVKNNTPVMVVIGNPPYSVSSSNKSKWIQHLIADYKKDLNERKLNLDDDYIKFIRFGQHYIDKNGFGVLAYISNNSFIDGITHRQMRKHLLESFDSIYILDLHGNAKKKETALDGSPDQNVFDIMQGVSINLLVKTGKKKVGELGKVFHYDLYGKREKKYGFLEENQLNSIQWQNISYELPYLFFVPRNFDSKSYKAGFNISELFLNYNSGIETKCDDISVHFQRETLETVLDKFKILPLDELKKVFHQKQDSSGWTFDNAKKTILNSNYVIKKMCYRPFDNRYTIYYNYSGGFIGRTRHQIMRNFLYDNFGLIFERQCVIGKFTNIFISNLLVDGHILGTAFSKGCVAPLYLYPTQTEGQLSLEENSNRRPNLNMEIVKQIAQGLGLAFTPEKEATSKNHPIGGNIGGTFAPIDLLDYIYAVLHSPTYRETYKEFLKIDFPRVPYPQEVGEFWRLVALGKALREIHLLESEKVEDYLTSYPIDGNNEVEKIAFVKANETDTAGKVYLNKSQYFEKVPEIAWNFYIGGYQPAQKWLKDRKGRILSFDDILHYQKIIVALNETSRLMEEIG